ncbi:hypothetical protein A2716_01555 [candidate division WWE3 bacterium RIFCSPHIGHO2_01_FULL_40_23]|uniref:Leucine--tRNA ligase n=1 Tax=candidate division WWE3 bacterium RIFCSPLOWO2_01_FULL_41_18 TaxID=1802625 RepID=A0A1F4VEJ2_UNCKA|nr:MAG: hypothetical protein A2716_01555 [candidate division WWE3 bacterium RIFCSPHIGHO2_01_FULL_40_23]OGC55682.1 MAG: hypothetical protein A3A78_01405 [candidate division WWE3 bacterium RIFCSPLOWO2_01_FULL_41_18]
MKKIYRPDEIEPKWQKKWETDKIYQVKDTTDKKKFYCLDMFPYPSGAGLHVGHVEGYTATDVYSRYMRASGYNVLHPMGWDAFGLPAENYAIKEKIHPKETTQKAIEKFKSQIKRTGLSYDWSREIDTSSPEYYKWTQWLFLLLFKNGLAYRKKAPVNWCPSCRTVLANEQVIKSEDKNVCERCGTEVVKKELEQWFFKITEYADRLLQDLSKIDWPQSTKQGQRNWIGRSDGAIISFKIDGSSEFVEVFTTRADTLFGATYLVLSPEHPAVLKVTKKEYAKEVEKYKEGAAKKSEIQRSAVEKEKSGVFTGSYAINPANDEKIPVWIADYVLMGYGTGAIMAVPAHDERDYLFAVKYKLPIKKVIKKEGNDSEVVYCDEEGVLENSGKYNGLNSELAREKIVRDLEKEGNARSEVTYKLRDWLISRQRYWGAPIPIIYCPHCAHFEDEGGCCGGECGCDHGGSCEGCYDTTEIDGVRYAIVPVPVEDLPVKLPVDVDFKPTGESPLMRSKDFQANVKCPKCGAIKGVKREVDTMDTFVDSSWYFFRFCDPHNDKEFASKEKMQKFLPVDMYMGGAEHTVLHLLYSRFLTKVLFDLGFTHFDEPFMKLRHQGLVLAGDSQKMSKRWGNIINPDDVISAFGADTMRTYEMFIGPIEATKAWSTQGVEGVRRFYNRVWSLSLDAIERGLKVSEKNVLKMVHKLIKKVGSDIEELKFNTAVSAMMEFSNFWKENKDLVGLDSLKLFVEVMAPFAPHIAEEIWEMAGEKYSVTTASWPEYDDGLIAEDEVTVVVSVNGKVRDRVKFTLGEIKDKELVKSRVLSSEKMREIISARNVKDFIYVEGKIVNIVLE